MVLHCPDEVISTYTDCSVANSYVVWDKSLKEEYVIKVEKVNIQVIRAAFNVEEKILIDLGEKEDADQYVVQLYDSFEYAGKLHVQTMEKFQTAQHDTDLTPHGHLLPLRV